MIKDRIQQGWTQGKMSTTQSGAEVDPFSPLAERFCLLGAVWKEYRYPNEDEALILMELFHALTGETPRSNSSSLVAYTNRLVYWNDDPVRTKEEVLALLDKAIAERE